FASDLTRMLHGNTGQRTTPKPPSIHDQSGNSVYLANRFLHPRQTPNIGSTQVSKAKQGHPLTREKSFTE
ncbi:hypothetical protein, partial [Pseudomonas jessenii]|uniref:hypothetical protein n=1 Tax=Pseudomonas jessenii TaxID=77298 RepID=UPI0019D49E99